MVSESWNHLNPQLTAMGMELFREIFRREPSTKALFKFAKLSDAELEKDLVFRGHSGRFMQAVGAVIDNVDSTDGQLQRLLLSIGGQHKYLDSFEKRYFTAFTLSLKRVCLSVCVSVCRFHGELRLAWKQVIKFMLTEIRTGYIRKHNELAAENGTPLLEEVDENPLDDLTEGVENRVVGLGVISEQDEPHASTSHHGQD
nr:hypothetical protein BaRGS_006481 [Batillaria attramentaria]